MKAPKVSILVPVYNADDALLSRALSSIFNQTIKDWEIVLVDDGSVNGCVERIPAAYRADPRLRVLRQENQGVEGVINTAINAARGEYFYCVAQDDYAHLQTLEYCLTALEDNGAELCVFNGYRQTVPDVPEFCELGVFGHIPCKVFVSNEMYTRADEYASTLCCLNTDAWGHFARTELVRKVHAVWPLYESYTRLYLMMRMAKKWMASEAKLYYYYTANPASLSKRAITARYIQRTRRDFEALCEMYEKERHDSEARKVWDVVHRSIILKGVKIAVNTFRRHNKHCDKAINRECLHAISQMLWSLKLRKFLPIAKINIRMYLRYCWIMWRYYRPEYKRIGDKTLGHGEFDEFLFVNNYVMSPDGTKEKDR